MKAAARGFRSDRISGYVFVAPAVALFAVFQIYPLFRTAVLSFQEFIGSIHVDECLETPLQECLHCGKSCKHCRNFQYTHRFINKWFFNDYIQLFCKVRMSSEEKRVPFKMFIMAAKIRKFLRG